MRLKLSHAVYGPKFYDFKPEGADADELMCELQAEMEVDVDDKHAEGPAWPPAFAEAAIREYCRFLALAYTFKEAVPALAVDEVWHQHICDTRRYSKDVENVFGAGVKLHHYPYFGLGGEHGERAELVDRFQRTIC